MQETRLSIPWGQVSEAAISISDVGNRQEEVGLPNLLDIFVHYSRFNIMGSWCSCQFIDEKAQNHEKLGKTLQTKVDASRFIPLS